MEEDNLKYIHKVYLRHNMLELIIINYNIYGLICNKYILYNCLSNYTRYEMIKLCIINRVQYVS
jgi:hypothetical protein